MAVHGVQKGDSIAHCAGHDVLAFNESPYKPILVAHQAEPICESAKLLDHADFGGRFKLRDDVAWLEATCEIEHSARRASGLAYFNVLGDHAQHLVVEPSVQHGFAKAPLISDLESRQRAFGNELQDRTLVDVQISGELVGGHQSIGRFERFCRAFTDDV